MEAASWTLQAISTRTCHDRPFPSDRSGPVPGRSFFMLILHAYIHRNRQILRAYYAVSSSFIRSHIHFGRSCVPRLMIHYMQCTNYSLNIRFTNSIDPGSSRIYPFRAGSAYFRSGKAVPVLILHAYRISGAISSVPPGPGSKAKATCHVVEYIYYYISV